MNYSLIRLRFDGLAHFGTSDSALSLFTSEDHFYADTLFSALCHTALSPTALMDSIRSFSRLRMVHCCSVTVCRGIVPRTVLITTCPSLAGLFLVSRKNRTCRRAAAKQ